MLKTLTFATAATAAGVLLLVLPGPSRAADIPNLVGAWAEIDDGARVVRRGGPFEHFDRSGDDAAFGSPGTFTLTVERQEGATFAGTWASPERADPMVGVIASDGRSLMLADDNGPMQGRILDNGDVEICRALADATRMMAACRTLRRGR
jgi:hypothetical protein